MVDDAAGISALGAILQGLAGGGPSTLSDIIKDSGIGRSTAFDVSRRMEESGLLSRQTDGQMTLGPLAGVIAFSAYGLGGIYEISQGMLPWLRDETGASVLLEATNGASSVILSNWPASALREIEHSRERMIAVSVHSRGRAIARLRLVFGAGTGEGDIASSRRLAEAVALRLEHALSG